MFYGLFASGTQQPWASGSGLYEAHMDERGSARKAAGSDEDEQARGGYKSAETVD